MPVFPSLPSGVTPEDIERLKIKKKIEEGKITEEEATKILAEREAVIIRQPVTTRYGVVSPPPISPIPEPTPEQITTEVPSAGEMQRLAEGLC